MRQAQSASILATFKSNARSATVISGCQSKMHTGMTPAEGLNVMGDNVACPKGGVHSYRIEKKLVCIKCGYISSAKILQKYSELLEENERLREKLRERKNRQTH
jgi:ribosomal protein L37E